MFHDCFNSALLYCLQEVLLFLTPCYSKHRNLECSSASPARPSPGGKGPGWFLCKERCGLALPFWLKGYSLSEKDSKPTWKPPALWSHNHNLSFPLVMIIPHQSTQSKLGLFPYPLHLVAKSYFGAVKVDIFFLCTNMVKRIRSR